MLVSSAGYLRVADDGPGLRGKRGKRARRQLRLMVIGRGKATWHRVERATGRRTSGLNLPRLTRSGASSTLWSRADESSDRV